MSLLEHLQSSPHFDALLKMSSTLGWIVEDRWQETAAVDPDERNLMLSGSPIASTVRRIGERADALAGYAGMAMVMQMAFTDEERPLGEWGHWAMTEINYAWAGIGEWQS